MEEAHEGASSVEEQINSVKESTDSELTKHVQDFLQKNPNNEGEDNASFKENIEDFLTKMKILREKLSEEQNEKLDYYMARYSSYIQHTFRSQLKDQDEKDIFSHLPKELLEGKLDKELKTEQFISGFCHSQQKILGKFLHFLYAYLEKFCPSITFHY
jgi:uncharacterized protein YpbB